MPHIEEQPTPWNQSPEPLRFPEPSPVVFPSVSYEMARYAIQSGFSGDVSIGVTPLVADDVRVVSSLSLLRYVRQHRKNRTHTFRLAEDSRLERDVGPHGLESVYSDYIPSTYVVSEGDRLQVLIADRTITLDRSDVNASSEAYLSTLATKTLIKAALRASIRPKITPVAARVPLVEKIFESMRINAFHNDSEVVQNRVLVTVDNIANRAMRQNPVVLAQGTELLLLADDSVRKIFSGSSEKYAIAGTGHYANEAILEYLSTQALMSLGGYYSRRYGVNEDEWKAFITHPTTAEAQGKFVAKHGMNMDRFTGLYFSRLGLEDVEKVASAFLHSEIPDIHLSTNPELRCPQ